MRKYLLVTLVYLLFSTPIFASYNNVQNIFYPNKFHSIIINGNFNIKIYNGYKKPKIIINSCPKDLNNISIITKNDTLYLNGKIKAPYNCANYISIYTDYINNFSYAGSGYIKGNINSKDLYLNINNSQKTFIQGKLGLRFLKVSGTGEIEIIGINSPNLILDIQNKAKVKLVGVANLAQINLQHNAWLSMYWVKSNYLKIIEKDVAYLRLAGLVHKLNIELWNRAQFDGRFLRSDIAFVKTHDKSFAKISSLVSQHTLALDQSDIFFYNLPVFKTDFMGNQGSSLDMRDLNLPNLRRYTPFNGQ